MDWIKETKMNENVKKKMRRSELLPHRHTQQYINTHARMHAAGYYECLPRITKPAAVYRRDGEEEQQPRKSCEHMVYVS